MSASEPVGLRLHEDPELFREALRFTTAQTGFQARLIEKDYFCSVLLAHLSGSAPELVFKGGTCLAKVHLGFHRMSEDLDFTLPTAVGSTRGERSRRASPAKAALDLLPRRIQGVRLVKPLTGANESMQYVATVTYDSCLARREESIQVEIGLREPLLAPTASGQARTLLLDPLSGTTHVEPVAIQCFSIVEALAEKFRAALARRDVAIRDFYDLDHAQRAGVLHPHELVDSIRRKLAVPGNAPPSASTRRLSELERQIETDLKPVLRPADLGSFELGRAWRLVADMAARLAE
jgi:predicted nucleotidyltransferase component of viral defense system